MKGLSEGQFYAEEGELDPEYITMGPHMISVPGPMGQPVPMVVVVPLCWKCIPEGKKTTGLLNGSGLMLPNKEGT